MATINAPNQQNQNFNTANAAPEQQNPAANSGVPTSSGQFSTLQKYLGANKNAGQRIAGMVGGNLEKESTQQKTTTQRELGESSQANQNFGNLTNETQGFTQQLSQPAAAPNTVNGKAYDVNSYSSNLSGQQAAKDIAADQNKFQRFTGIRTGDIGQQQQAESQKQANEAIVAASKAYDLNKQRQSQLTNNQGRDQLISNTLNTKNQRAGVRNLDNAFLTQDKTKSLNNISNNLRQDVGSLQASIDSGKMSADQIIALKQAQQQAETGLTGRLTDMDKEYNDLLANRMTAVNAAKDNRMQALRDQFLNLQNNKEIKSEFADLIGLNDAIGVGALDTSGDVSAQGGMNNKEVRLFNLLKDQNLGNVLDTNVLESKALTNADVANQQDIENLGILAKLSGNTPSISQASRFTGNQTNKKDLADRINDRAGKFLTDDLTKTFTGSGYKQEDIGGSSSMARAYSNAAASLNDVLNGNIYRNTQGTQSRGWENSLGNIAGTVLTGGLSPILNDNARGDLQTDINNTLEGVIKGGTNIIPGALVGLNPQTSNAVGGYLRGLQGQMRGTGMTADGGLSGRNIGSGEWGRSMNYADAQSVGQVKDQADQYIKDIGYNNLVKIAKGEI